MKISVAQKWNGVKSAKIYRKSRWKNFFVNLFSDFQPVATTSKGKLLTKLKHVRKGKHQRIIFGKESEYHQECRSKVQDYTDTNNSDENENEGELVIHFLPGDFVVYLLLNFRFKMHSESECSGLDTMGIVHESNL